MTMGGAAVEGQASGGCEGQAVGGGEGQAVRERAL